MQISPSSLKLKPLSLTKKYKDTRYITFNILRALVNLICQEVGYLKDTKPYKCIKYTNTVCSVRLVEAAHVL